MPLRSRRTVLRSGAVIATLLAGCTAPSQPPQGDAESLTETTESPPTETSTETQHPQTSTQSTTDTEESTTPPYDPSLLSPRSKIVKQESSESPAEVELSLTNNGDHPVPVSPESSGLPLEFLTLSDDSDHSIYFVPKSQRHVHIRGGELPESRIDGCWQLPEGSKFVVEDLDFDTVIEPDETYVVSHYIFEPSKTSSCFPPGTYSTTSTLKLAETMMDGPSFDLRYTLIIDDQKQLSISVEKLETVTN